MVNIWRVTTVWTGGRIGTGYTNHFFTEDVGTASAAAAASASFFQTAFGVTGTKLPTGIKLTFPSVVDVIDPATGELKGGLGVTPTSPLSGSDSSAYSAVVGQCVTWVTGDVLEGHHITGRTFLVPGGGSGLSTDGTPLDSWNTQIQSAADALVAAAPEFIIWRRPTSAAAGNGSSHPVVAGRIKDTPVYLTSRR